MEKTFRDGKREVPEHLAEMMAGMETFRFNFSDAIDEANRRQMGEYLSKAQNQAVRDHFEKFR
jgi:hypothetical protein